jgi:hypothetical protein
MAFSESDSRPTSSAIQRIFVDVGGVFGLEKGHMVRGGTLPLPAPPWRTMPEQNHVCTPKGGVV